MPAPAHMPPVMTGLADHIRFASDAEELLWAAAACLLVALLALWAEGRRNRRKRVDAVGFMPWTGVFFAFAFLAAGLGAAGVKGLFAG